MMVKLGAEPWMVKVLGQRISPKVKLGIVVLAATVKVLVTVGAKKFQACTNTGEFERVNRPLVGIVTERPIVSTAPK